MVHGSYYYEYMNSSVFNFVSINMAPWSVIDLATAYVHFNLCYMLTF
jgi:hypothetical protein